MESDLSDFQACRPALLGLAYRMLGDLGRAEDVVQDAWVRWQKRAVIVRVPRAFLLTTVARLCLNELESGRARLEELRSDRLPEPIDLRDAGLTRAESLDRVSMAFLVLLQRLTPAERAALLLHDVFDFDHAEIAHLLDRSEAASRQLLVRARSCVASGRRSFTASPQEHARLLSAFAEAASRGDVEGLTALLAEDALLVADAGPSGGRFGRVRNIGVPLTGATKVAAFIASAGLQAGRGLSWVTRPLNGLPAFLVLRDDVLIAAILLSVQDESIAGIFIQADPDKLRRLKI